jgi:hypothetical protein
LRVCIINVCFGLKSGVTYDRFFNKIKQCRRVATRYDKLAANYLAFVKLACIRLGYAFMSSRPSPSPLAELMPSKFASTILDGVRPQSCIILTGVSRQSTHSSGKAADKRIYCPLKEDYATALSHTVLAERPQGVFRECVLIMDEARRMPYCSAPEEKCTCSAYPLSSGHCIMLAKVNLFRNGGGK